MNIGFNVLFYLPLLWKLDVLGRLDRARQPRGPDLARVVEVVRELRQPQGEQLAPGSQAGVAAQPPEDVVESLTVSG